MQLVRSLSQLPPTGLDLSGLWACSGVEGLAVPCRCVASCLVLLQTLALISVSHLLQLSRRLGNSACSFLPGAPSSGPGTCEEPEAPPSCLHHPQEQKQQSQVAFRWSAFYTLSPLILTTIHFSDEETEVEGEVTVSEQVTELKFEPCRQNLTRHPNPPERGIPATPNYPPTSLQHPTTCKWPYPHKREQGRCPGCPVQEAR